MKLYQIYTDIILENVPNQNMDDLAHDRAREETGYWGQAGAGAMIMALETGRILLPLRSQHVEEPRTWGGTWGGAIDSSEDPSDAAKRETHEESGYSGQVKMIPLSVFQDGDFKYFNFLAVVPKEYKPRLNWETETAEWTDFGKWPSPRHFGLDFILDDNKSVNIIKKVASHNQSS